MNRVIAAGLGMFASVAPGAVAVQSLHAQAKPPVYLVGLIDVSNPDGLGKEFAPQAQLTVIIAWDSDRKGIELGVLLADLQKVLVFG